MDNSDKYRIYIGSNTKFFQTERVPVQNLFQIPRKPISDKPGKAYMVFKRDTVLTI